MVKARRRVKRLTAQNSQRRELMGAEMSNMGNESVRQQTVPPREIRRIHQPSQ